MDYASWKTRGWCRFEMLARQMSSQTMATTPFLVRDDGTLVQVDANDHVGSPVGRGEFSNPEDAALLAPRVKQMVEARLRMLRQAGRWRDYRNLLSTRHALCDGLPLPWWEAAVLSPPCRMRARRAWPASCVTSTWRRRRQPSTGATR